MLTRIFGFLGIICCLTLLIPISPVEAANGSPGSASFGYGLFLDVQEAPEYAIETAQEINLDWVAVEFDWTDQWPAKNTSINWTQLDRVFSLIEDSQVSVMVSITNPPGWVLTANGPDPDLTAELCRRLSQRYPKAELAIELFPGANTLQGWGVAPKPESYLALFRTVQSHLNVNAIQTVLILGGLDPIRHSSSPDTISDISFLQKLYVAGAASVMPIIGIRLSGIGASPTISPQEASEISLRHYEAIRTTMLENGHQSGLIWVTGFSWDGSIVSTPEAQAQWLKQAFLMMRRQLYIGAAFLNETNSNSSPNHSLINNASFHLGIDSLREIIAFENSQQAITFKFQFLKSSTNKLVKFP